MKKALLIIVDGMEECEALVTYDLLYRAGIKIDLVSKKNNIISSHNVTIAAQKLLKDINIDEYDCLILPGGMPGTKNLEDDNDVLNIIDYFFNNNKYIAAICAAPSILLHKGLLKNKKFVCYPGFESGYDAVESKVVQDNNFITAKGLGAVFEFSYLIIKNLINEEKAKEVLNSIQF